MDLTGSIKWLRVRQTERSRSFLSRPRSWPPTRHIALLHFPSTKTSAPNVSYFPHANSEPIQTKRAGRPASYADAYFGSSTSTPSPPSSRLIRPYRAHFLLSMQTGELVTLRSLPQVEDEGSNEENAPAAAPAEGAPVVLRRFPDARVAIHRTRFNPNLPASSWLLSGTATGLIHGITLNQTIL